jgi:hypothetical protein
MLKIFSKFYKKKIIYLIIFGYLKIVLLFNFRFLISFTKKKFIHLFFYSKLYNY